MADKGESEKGKTGSDMEPTVHLLLGPGKKKTEKSEDQILLETMCARVTLLEQRFSDPESGHEKRLAAALSAIFEMRQEMSRHMKLITATTDALSRLDRKVAELEDRIRKNEVRACNLATSDAHIKKVALEAIKTSATHVFETTLSEALESDRKKNEFLFNELRKIFCGMSETCIGIGQDCSYTKERLSLLEKKLEAMKIDDSSPFEEKTPGPSTMQTEE